MLVRLVVFAPLLLLASFGCGPREITYERTEPLTFEPAPSSSEPESRPTDGGDRTEDNPSQGGGERPKGGTAPPAMGTTGGGETAAPTETCAFPNCGCFGHQDCPADRFCFLNRCIVSHDCADCRSSHSVCVVAGDRAVCDSCDPSAMYSCAQYLPERRYCDRGRCVCRRAEDCGYGGWCVEGDCTYASNGFGSDDRYPPGNAMGDLSSTSSSSAAERDAGADASLPARDTAVPTEPSEMTWR